MLLGRCVGVLSVLLFALMLASDPVAARALHKSGQKPSACLTAFPQARSTTKGHTTSYNRQESVEMVVCWGFGRSSKEHFQMTAGMACALLAQAIGVKHDTTGLFVDGACSGAELASHPDLETKVGAACGFMADLLEVPLPLAGKAAGLACTVTPSVGHLLGAWAESRHERDIARDVIHKDRCVQYSPRLGSPWSAVKCARSDAGFTHLPGPPKAKQPPLPVMATPVWIKLPGTVLSNTDAALLTADNVLGGDSATFTVIGTRSGPGVPIAPSEGLPGGTTVSTDSELLTDPSPGHPLGLVVLTLNVTFPENGINPPYSEGYFSVFDAATGTRLLTSAAFDPNADWNSALIDYVNGNVVLAYNDFITIGPSGNVTHTPFPGNGDPNATGYGSYVESPTVKGLVLVNGYDQPQACPTVYVVAVAGLQTMSQTPCLGDLNDDNYSDWYFDGSVFGVPDTPAIFSTATGQPVSAPGEFGSDASSNFVGPGIRSDVALIQDGASGYSYFVSTSTWQPVFTANPNQEFTAYGIADDDVWVDTSVFEGEGGNSGGPYVIDGRTGATLAKGWSVFPVTGGSGWTLTSTLDECCETQYLLRWSGTLLSASASAPSS